MGEAALGDAHHGQLCPGLEDGLLPARGVSTEIPPPPTCSGTTAAPGLVLLGVPGLAVSCSACARGAVLTLGCAGCASFGFVPHRLCCSCC